jgi:origin recognition complex subunit 3
VFSGLLHPQDYGAITTTNDDVDSDDEETLWDMPDTSILFQRYLESGKMINVFDWFDSFTVVLETQKQRHESAREVLMRTPTRRKGKQRHLEADQSYPEGSEEELEKWRLEVQARFIRSLHELDYIGLIKHTGRKADHVMRTVFDVAG